MHTVSINVLRKADTSDGFSPVVTVDDSMRGPTRASFRLDGQLDASVLSPALVQIILGMARIRNVVSSIRMEGRAPDFSRAREVLETRKPTSDNETQTLRFLDRYQWIHETPSSSLPDPDLAFVTDLHQELFAGEESYAPGTLKTESNGILDTATGNMIFECTPPERVETEIDSLLDWYHEAREQQLETVVAATWFAEFEAIHPFVDGNGRIGRLVNLMLLKKLGLENAPLVPLDARFYRTRAKYYEKLSATNTGTNWHVWARYYCRELGKAYRHAVAMADLRPMIESQTSKPTRAFLEWILSRASSGWFKRGDYPNPHTYSSAALTKGLASLTEQGILMAKGDRKGRRYRLGTDTLEEIFVGLTE